MNFLFKNKLVKMNYFVLIFLTFIIIYFLIVVGTYLFQRNLLYHPKENNYSGDLMNLCQWLNSLTLSDHLILLILFLIGLYFSKTTLDGLVYLYKKKQGNNPYQIKYRIKPFTILILALFYTIILYTIMSKITVFSNG